MNHPMSQQGHAFRCRRRTRQERNRDTVGGVNYVVGGSWGDHELATGGNHVGDLVRADNGAGADDSNGADRYFPLKVGLRFSMNATTPS